MSHTKRFFFSYLMVTHLISPSNGTHRVGEEHPFVHLTNDMVHKYVYLTIKKVHSYASLTHSLLVKVYKIIY